MKITANIKPKLHQERKLIEWDIKEERVFLSLSGSGADIAKDLDFVDSGSPATLLFLDDGWSQSSELFAEVSKHTRIVPYSIQELIRPMGDGYEYYHETPFAELICQHDFLSRFPRGMLTRPILDMWRISDLFLPGQIVLNGSRKKL